MVRMTSPDDGVRVVVDIGPDATDEELAVMAKQFFAGMIKNAEDVSPREPS